MPAAHPLLDALSRCEVELQRIAAEAMASGDYATARTGMELAESVAEQRKRTGLGPATTNANPSAAPKTAQKSPPAKPSLPQKSKSAPPARKAKAPATTSPAFRSSRASKYPRFAREDDKLIKIGWSKRTREEYQHKAPRSSVDAFIAHLRKHTKADRIFKIDDLLPVPDPDNNGELPAYQVYLILAWLRDMGTASKHGRDGYSVAPSALSEKSLAQTWNQLKNLTT